MQGRRIRVRGQVQGVGFRPFIWQLAKRLRLQGSVLNDPEGVLIHAAGDKLDEFEIAIRTEAPTLARVDGVESEEIDLDPPDSFEIVASQGLGAETRVTPDAATCPDCLNEIRDPNDRRYGYAFANCTHCGPRYTILNHLPYDREQTTMAAFKMCEECASEYGDPADRRFHAQPIACPVCGPHIWIEPTQGDEPIEDAVNRLRAGEILAVKGLGGFHLTCDASNADAIKLLRERKRRPSKPFALMGTMEMIAKYCSISADDIQLLEDPAAPIVLLEKTANSLPEILAPGQSTLGWMLPYTPLHHLLMDGFDRPIVMTSGNVSGEPLAVGNGEARKTLAEFVDAFVMHDRDIARRLDDSVERTTPHGPMVLRRARGRVPGTISLPPGFEEVPQVIGYGGQMKAAICLIKNGQALLGHHLGELDEALTWDAFIQADRDYGELFDHRPEIIAVDLHPEFRATQHGKARAQEEGQHLIAVQHHHAHLASCMAENGWPIDGGKVAGIILDGLGLGPDGTIWGGEVLLGDYHDYQRHAYLRPAPLIGGDRAQIEPWRNALVRLDETDLSDWANALFADVQIDLARQAAAKGINTPMSSSAGRLFDAVAACLGICKTRQSFEGEAAMRLEALATGTIQPGYDFGDKGPEIDPSPVFQAVYDDLSARITMNQISGRFHSGIARAFAQKASALVESGVAQAVALSGGCFQNPILLGATIDALGDVPVLVHKKSPPNDGGIALGQAVIAAAHYSGRMESR